MNHDAAFRPLTQAAARWRASFQPDSFEFFLGDLDIDIDVDLESFHYPMIDAVCTAENCYCVVVRRQTPGPAATNLNPISMPSNSDHPDFQRASILLNSFRASTSETTPLLSFWIATGGEASMKVLRFVLIACLCAAQVGCGTYIPSQRDWPNSRPRDVEDMNIALVRTIVCELSYAVTVAIRNDREGARRRRSERIYTGFLDHWGVEVATDLTASESSTVNPSGLWAPISPASAVFTLGGGIRGAAVASNENTFNVFYPLAALYQPTVFPTDDPQRPCRNPTGNKDGSPLVDIDLKIQPLLESRAQLVEIGVAEDPDRQAKIYSVKNVLTQTVSIKETVSGDITPTWKFTTGSVNPSGTFFSTSRERTHQIVFTFGPLAGDGRSLTDLAEAFHLNEQLKAGLRNSR
ncbi:MAG: hypothetical protein JWP25_8489 [Bradyrhizobium sp.]|nr:hypothetical protein [Bradyrhizobium sp.]